MEENKVETTELIDTNEEVVVDEQPVVQEEPVEEAKTSKIDQKVTKKDILISLGIILGVLVISISVILGCVFGIATTKANEQINVEMMDGHDWSRTYLCAWLNNRNDMTNNNLELPQGTLKYELIEFELKKFDKDLKVERPIEESHYTFTYVFVVRNEKYAVVMDARSGEILEVEIL